jgi:hypothetical protein
VSLLTKSIVILNLTEDRESRPYHIWAMLMVVAGTDMSGSVVGGVAEQVRHESPSSLGVPPDLD